MKIKMLILQYRENLVEQFPSNLFEQVIGIIIESPDILSDIFQSIFLIFVLLWETTNNFFNNDEDNQEQGKKDKGKGRATQEQEEQWYRESIIKSVSVGGNESGDDDDRDDYNKKKDKDEKEEKDEILAKLMQAEFDKEDIINYEDMESLSSYSVLSSVIGEDDDDYSANRKLDILELEEKLRAEKEKHDKIALSHSIQEKEEKDEKKENKKRKFSEDKEESNYSCNRTNKK